MRPFVSTTAVLILATLSATGGACASEPEPGTIVALVRHAEKQAGDDPELSLRGRQRALTLARMLESAGIEVVYSTETRRTQQTAQPLADQLGLTVQPYDGSDLRGLVTKLSREQRRVLVVGHSNTTHQLAELLGGEAGPEISEDEYDRLYLLTLPPGGAAVTTLLRFDP